MMRKAGQVGASIAFGVATEAMNRRVNERTGQLAGPTAKGPAQPAGSSGTSSFERGDTKLTRLAGNIRPDERANPWKDGAGSFIESRKKALSSAANVGSAVATGKVGLQDLNASLAQMKDEVVFTTKAAKVLGQGDLDTRDGVRVAGAGARHAGQQAIEALSSGDPLAALKGAAHATKAGAEGTFATATVSDSGMDKIKDAVSARTQYETRKVATSVTLATGAGVAAGMVHPALGMAVRTVGGMAVGHQVGEAAHKIHGGAETGEVGAMRAEWRKIIEEKASK